MDEDLRRRIFAIRITVETNFCGDEEMQYEELRIQRNARQRNARQRNVETKKCGRRNADEEMRTKKCATNKFQTKICPGIKKGYLRGAGSQNIALKL